MSEKIPKRALKYKDHSISDLFDALRGFLIGTEVNLNYYMHKIYIKSFSNSEIINSLKAYLKSKGILMINYRIFMNGKISLDIPEEVDNKQYSVMTAKFDNYIFAFIRIETK